MELTNREISLLIWGAVFAAWALSVPPVRKGLGPVFRSLITPVIGIPLILMAGYVAGVAAVLYRFGLWEPADAKDTILWFLAFAVVSFFETPQISRNPSRLKTVIGEVFSLGVLIEFVMGLLVMSLWLELVLIPLLVIVALLLVAAQRRKEHAQVAGFLRVVQSLMGLALALFVAVQLVTRFSQVANVDTVREFALPIALSLLFVPFLYLTALYAGYDGVLRRLGWDIRDRDVRAYARRRTVVLCNVRLGTLAAWSRAIARAKFDSRASVDAAVAEFRARPEAA